MNRLRTKDLPATNKELYSINNEHCLGQHGLVDFLVFSSLLVDFLVFSSLKVDTTRRCVTNAQMGLTESIPL